MKVKLADPVMIHTGALTDFFLGDTIDHKRKGWCGAAQLETQESGLSGQVSYR